MGLAAMIGFLLAGSVVLAVVNARRLEGSVPGKAPILGLAAAGNGFLIGTADGMLKSADGVTWEPVAGFEGEVLVAGGGSTAVVVAGRRVSVTSNLEEFSPVGGRLDDPTAVSATPQGRYWIADREGNRLISGDETGFAPSDISLAGGPREVLSLAVVGGEGTEVLAGGLTSGLWRFDGTWQRILGTPIRAILADPASPDRYFLGTSGGVLVAGRTAPEFTDLRIPVEALTEAGGTYYAITSDRLLYESQDGTTWTARAAAGR